MIERVRLMRQAELDSNPMAVLGFVRDVILLLKDVAGDPRVSRSDKWIAVAAAAYLASPVDLIPDVIPVLGQLDDLGVAAVALRRLLSGAGYEVIHDLWRGSDEGLALLLALAGVQR